MTRTTEVEPHSIAKIVSIRLDDDGDQWRLSLVQRAAVWDETKVRYLLDSLLCGYPIGSLLLCSVRTDGSVLVEEDGLRIRTPAVVCSCASCNGYRSRCPKGERSTSSISIRKRVGRG